MSATIATRVSRYSETSAVIREDLIPAGDDWTFLRGEAEPAGAALAWTRPAYADDSWESGPVGIGYGDGAIDATPLDYMRQTPTQAGYRTVYLRHGFTIDDPVNEPA